jgi:hypothetical protein
VLHRIGALVLPSLEDTHAHAPAQAGRNLNTVDLRTSPGRTEYLDAIARYE